MQTEPQGTKQVIIDPDLLKNNNIYNLLIWGKYRNREDEPYTYRIYLRLKHGPNASDPWLDVTADLEFVPGFLTAVTRIQVDHSIRPYSPVANLNTQASKDGYREIQDSHPEYPGIFRGIMQELKSYFESLKEQAAHPAQAQIGPGPNSPENLFNLFSQCEGVFATMLEQDAQALSTLDSSIIERNTKHIVRMALVLVETEAVIGEMARKQLLTGPELEQARARQHSLQDSLRKLQDVPDLI